MLTVNQHLELADLKKLISEDLLAIRVAEFIDPVTARKLAFNILKDGYDKYTNAQSIGRIGMAYYETEGDLKKISDYFEQRDQNFQELRNKCKPYLSPMDLARCHLDEVWPTGAFLQSLQGQKMFAGLSRVVEPGVTFLAHHDLFIKDAPNTPEALSLKGQFACNIYLSMPSHGGELQIWQQEMSTQDFDRMRGSSYGIAPEQLGKPDLSIKPQLGDMIIFNTKKMHAVSAGNDKNRLSLSFFIGFRGWDEPLSIWS